MPDCSEVPALLSREHSISRFSQAVNRPKVGLLPTELPCLHGIVVYAGLVAFLAQKSYPAVPVLSSLIFDPSNAQPKTLDCILTDHKRKEISKSWFNLSYFY